MARFIEHSEEDYDDSPHTYRVTAELEYLRALTEEDFPSSRDVAQTFVKNTNLGKLNTGAAADDIKAKAVYLGEIQSLMKFYVTVTQEFKAKTIVAATQDFLRQVHSDPFELSDNVPNVALHRVEVTSVEKIKDKNAT